MCRVNASSARSCWLKGFLVPTRVQPTATHARLAAPRPFRLSHGTSSLEHGQYSRLVGHLLVGLLGPSNQTFKRRTRTFPGPSARTPPLSLSGPSYPFGTTLTFGVLLSSTSSTSRVGNDSSVRPATRPPTGPSTAVCPETSPCRSSHIILFTHIIFRRPLVHSRVGRQTS